MPLKEYISKRRFSKTPEPEGRLSNSDKPIFVVQKHKAQALHYDFRLEMNGVLKSWAVPKGPSMDPKDKRLAMMVEDHPLEYAQFSGTIPEGEYGAGQVEIWDKGTVDFVNRDVDGGHLTFILDGKRLKGEFALIKIRHPHTHKGNPWLLIKAAKDVKTKNFIEEKELKNPPHLKSPMLATLAKETFNAKGWLFEIKWDGYRAIAEKMGDNIELYSRNDVSFNERFPIIVQGLKKINHDFVIDGEVVVLDDEGRSRFQLLQDYFQNPTGKNLIYYAFDLIWLDGKDLRELPLAERKMQLESLTQHNQLIKFSDYVEEKGKDFFKIAVKKDIEGIIAKDANSPYLETRSNFWQKVKNINEQEVVIGGFTEPRGSRKHFGSLILGVYDKGKLVYVGHSGTGFNEDSLEMIRDKMKPLVTKECPFDIVPKTNEPATWLKPKLVGEIKFTEWTNEGLMRHPVFLGIREDKKPEEVRREK